MKNKRIVSAWLVPGLFVMILAACGGGKITIGGLPIFSGATELKAGESTIGTTLANNGVQDAAMRKAMGAGGQTEQKGFKLPENATWDAVKGFYEKELRAGGWESGLGGAANQFADVNGMLNAANHSNDLVRTLLFSRGSQTLTVIMMTMPTNTKEKELILSLSTR